MADRPIENAKNASIVTSDEVETRVPYDKDHEKLSAVYGIDANTSDKFEKLLNESVSEAVAETNTSTNATEGKGKMKVECTPRVLAEDEVCFVVVWEFCMGITKFA